MGHEDDVEGKEPEYGEVVMGLAGATKRYPVIGTINTLSTALFDRKNTIGDQTKDAEDYISTLIMSDLSGGMNVEDMNEASDVARCWSAFADIRRPGKIALNTRVRQLVPSGASGTAYPCGTILNTAYTIFGTKIYGWDEAGDTWYTGVTTTLTPVEKPVRYIGKIFIPCGSAGYLIISETGTPGTPTVTTVAGAGGVQYPASYTAGTPITTSPLPRAFCVFDQKLWCLTTGGALAWSFTGASNEWTWPYNEEQAIYPRLETGTTPQNIKGYYNPNGEPELFIISDRAVFRYNWSARRIIDTPAQFAPHPDFGGGVAVWRAQEDLRVSAGLDMVSVTAANVAVPLSGLHRDDGVPQELRGSIVDLEAETSELYALVGPSTSGDPAYAYNDKIEAAGTGNGQFANPRGLTVDGSGNVFVCDTDNERVQKLDTALDYVSKFGTSGTGNGEFAANNGAWDIAEDPSGNLWVVDRGNHRVQKFNSSGVYQSQFGTFDDGTALVVGSSTWTLQATYGSTGSGTSPNFDTPGQVVVDSTTHVFVADSGNTRLMEITTSGTYVAHFGTPYPPTGVAVVGDYVYIPEASGGNFRLDRYDANAGILAVGFSPTAGTSKHIATDGTYLYIVVNDTIQKRAIATLSTITATFGGTGSGNGQFNTPWGIWVSNGGAIYVVDQANSRVQVLNTSGVFQRQWTLPTSTCRGIVGDSAGRILVADYGADTVYRYTNTGTLIDSFSQADPDGIGINSSDILFVAEAGSNDRIRKWEDVVVVPVAAAPPATGTFNLPESIDINDTSGRIYVADTSNHRVQFFTSSGVYAGTIGSNTYNATTGAMVASSSAGYFDTPVALSVSPITADVYVVDQGNDRIQQFDEDGVFIRAFGSSGTGNGQFQTATAIAIHPTSGAVFVADSGRDNVQEFTAAGTFVRSYGTSGTGNGQFQNASGIAFDGTGTNFYVADTNPDRVQEFLYSAANAGNTYPWLAAWSGVGWYGKWRGVATAIIPTWAIVTSTTTAYRLWWGCNDGYVYTMKLRRTFHNPRQGLLALTDEFEEEGEIITPRFDAAMLGFWKLASHLVVFLDNASSDGEEITIEYRTDADSSWVELGTVSTTSKTYLPFNPSDDMPEGEGLAFNWIQFRIRLFRGTDVFQTPLWKSIVLCYQKIPQNSDAFNFVVAFPPDEYTPGRDGAVMRGEIADLVTARRYIRLKFTDQNGIERAYRGYLTAVTGDDDPSALVSGQRNVNFIAIRTSES